MTTFGRIFLCVITLLTFASFGLAQERSVKAVRTPSGRLELFSAEASEADINAELATRLKAEHAKLRAEYKGKTFWFRPAYVALRIIDVVAVEGDVKFVLQKSTGESLTADRLPSDVFFTRDPRQIFPARVWAYIEQSKLFIGMTKDQALASWGRPESVNRTITRSRVFEQWVYGSGSYLYFANGRLTTIQD